MTVLTDDWQSAELLTGVGQAVDVTDISTFTVADDEPAFSYVDEGRTGWVRFNSLSTVLVDLDYDSYDLDVWRRVDGAWISKPLINYRYFLASAGTTYYLRAIDRLSTTYDSTVGITLSAYSLNSINPWGSYVAGPAGGTTRAAAGALTAGQYGTGNATGAVNDAWATSAGETGLGALWWTFTPTVTSLYQLQFASSYGVGIFDGTTLIYSDGPSTGRLRCLELTGGVTYHIRITRAAGQAVTVYIQQLLPGFDYQVILAPGGGFSMSGTGLGSIGGNIANMYPDTFAGPATLQLNVTFPATVPPANTVSFPDSRVVQQAGHVVVPGPDPNSYNEGPRFWVWADQFGNTMPEPGGSWGYAPNTYQTRVVSLRERISVARRLDGKLDQYETPVFYYYDGGSIGDQIQIDLTTVALQHYFVTAHDDLDPPDPPSIILGEPLATRRRFT